MRSIYSILFFTGLTALLVAIYGFTITGSPAHARDIKFDEKRVTDLQEISYAVQTYATTNNRLPQVLSELTLMGNSNITDPETNTPYQYLTEGENTYKLCATFKTEVLEKTQAYGYINPEFKHPKGYYCFTKQVTIYNQYNNVNLFNMPTKTLPGTSPKTTPVVQQKAL